MSRVLPNAKLDRFGLRLDSLESHAAAFYARQQGATIAEVKRELGSVPRIIVKLTAKGYKFKIVTDKDTGNRRFFLQAGSTRNERTKAKTMKQNLKEREAALWHETIERITRHGQD